MSDLPVLSGVKVNREAADVLRAEAQAVLALVLDPDRRSRLAGLIAAVDEGLLDDEAAGDAEEVLSLALSSGRVRALYGPEGETAIVSLLRRLPRGRAAVESAREVTAALASLEGRTLDGVSVHVLSPGEFAFSISADGLELSARLGRGGVRLNTVAI
ncbi:MAG TPA: hypothetical protein VIJ70_01525 [Gaiellaceae bacterium]